MLRHLDLFSGIGGWSLAGSWTGKMQTIGFCEIEPFNRRVLAKHWPGVPQHDDIRTLSADLVRAWGTPDLISGSYPCQSFSLAGKRRGMEDDRYLWPEMHRLVDALRPRYVVAENVTGHITLGLDRVLDDLEASGYACGAVVLPAASVNAFHARHRVWVLAYADRGDAGQPEPQSERDPASLARIGDPDLPHGPDQLGERIGRAWDWCVESPDCDPDDDVSNPFGLRDGIQRAWLRAQSDRHRTDLSHAAGFGRSAGIPGPQQGEEGYAAIPHDDHPSLPGDDTTEGVPALGLVDPGADGVSAGLVRRLAARSVDIARLNYASGQWEAELPNWSVGEENRRRKVRAMGNAIQPQVAYEILSVMLADEVAA